MSIVTLLDGGMGQELLRRSSRKVTPMWSADIMLNEPILVRDLHREFIESGARVITLNTYTATPQRLKRENELGQLTNLHQQAMRAAQEAIELTQRNDVLIAGCLPPLVASYHPDVSLSFEDSLANYRRLVTLQSPASDLFICETMSSITEASAACTAAIESGKPVWVALTVSDEHPRQLRSGELLEDALLVLDSFNVQAILLNCSQPEAISACWSLLNTNQRKTGAYANGFVSVDSLYPGDTVEELEMRQDMSPQQYAEHAMSWVRNGASIIGGCCEIGPLHIKAIYSALCSEGYI
ncbi:MAG: S-methylmethionine-dependent homocysteine/selenocysteine methylase [Paraglaciecola sp.]|jgi:S-methylmethionine-dependent homocysteine/selenocysteine methylase|uniref:homocysteine S-methyltransferase family protein n=1 Tax=uncultured Paraglaciecola sp. TaxID=1765024 RepID=UPI0025FDD6EF|nr:homocysteine S-methyltransferase family protein [uncultured Paraglaciecola sp.]